MSLKIFCSVTIGLVKGLNGVVHDGIAVDVVVTEDILQC